MSIVVRILIGVVAILHGLVHPLLALIPPPVDEAINDVPAVMGSFWTKSWLFGDGAGAKLLLYVLTALTALAMLVGGIGFIVGPAAWASTPWLAGAGLSLLVLVVFWKKDFVFGIVLDVLMIAAAFTSWFPG